MYTVEPLYKGHAGTMKIVLYTEVSFTQRFESISTGLKQVSLIERCPLFGESFIPVLRSKRNEL